MGGIGNFRFNIPITPFAPCKIIQRNAQIVAVKVGPQNIRKVKFGVGQLPQHKVADALFAAAAYQQIRRRHISRRQIFGEIGFVEFPAGIAQLFRRLQNIPLPAVADGDKHGYVFAVGGVALHC